MRIGNFIHAKLFKISHILPYPNFFNQCDKLSHKLTKAELSEKQNQMLKEIVNYSYDEIMYYHDLFNSLKLAPKDIQKTSDLEKLPILTKEDVKKS
jgi:phenylacetate-CoA ligase